MLGAPSEFDTIWSDANTFKPRPLVETKPQIEISNLVQNDTNLSFDLKTDSPTKIIIRKIYFPGWKVKLNDKEYKKQESCFLKAAHHGCIRIGYKQEQD